MITLDGVTKVFPDGTVAVAGLSFDVPRGDVLALLGSSGSGKTTTLRMINRLVEPTSGRIAIDGRDVRDEDVHRLRRGIGYVIQQAGLFPHRTVLDNVMTVPRLLGWDRRTAKAKAREMLELVGLEASLADRYPAQLSGGQQQRVGVARALVSQPPVLLMDEPFGAVDPIVRQQLQVEFRRVQQELSTTVVFVTHDVDEAVTIASTIVVLRPGGVAAQIGTPRELLAAPADEFVADFLGSDRALKLLGLDDVADVRCRPLDAAVHGHLLEIATMSWRGEGDAVAADVVRPGTTARRALELAMASPVRAVVVADATGRPRGVSTVGDLTGDVA